MPLHDVPFIFQRLTVTRQQQFNHFSSFLTPAKLTENEYTPNISYFPFPFLSLPIEKTDYGKKNYSDHRRTTFGKSSYDKALLAIIRPSVYLATSRIWDEEYRERIRRHQQDRGPQWTNIEEEKQLSRHALQGRVIVIDCLTLWATNFFFDNNSDVGQSLQELKQEFDKFTAPKATFIFVTNETVWEEYPKILFNDALPTCKDG